MRDWVKLYLLEEVEKTNGGHRIGREQAEYGMNQIKGELENDETVFNRLADKLRTHFSAYGFASEGWAFKAAFGSILSDLPGEVFLQLVGMRHVFYTFTPNPGAEVKPFVLNDEENAGDWDRILVVPFPYAVYTMPPMARQGSTVHELPHVCVHSDKAASTDAMEDEADRVAGEWGFKEEIEAMREYGARYGL